MLKYKIPQIVTLTLNYFYDPLAEAGGFEPPVRLPVRQFSKLVVSATHPNFLLFRSVISQTRCKDKGIN